MKLTILLRLLIVGMLLIILTSLVVAFAAGTGIPASNVGQDSVPVTAEEIKPSACAGIFLVNIISGSGTLIGTIGNDLVIGSPGVDVIDGLAGNDCILGGGGDDSLTGLDGNDVCLGGPGNDIFTECEVEEQ